MMKGGEARRAKPGGDQLLLLLSPAKPTSVVECLTVSAEEARGGESRKRHHAALLPHITDQVVNEEGRMFRYRNTSQSLYW